MVVAICISTDIRPTNHTWRRSALPSVCEDEFFAQPRPEQAVKQFGTPVAHLQHRYSPAKHIRVNNQPLRLEAHIRVFLRLMFVHAARSGTPLLSPIPHVERRVGMEVRRSIIHVMPTGGQYAKRRPKSSPRHSGMLRHLRRKIRAYPLLLLANGGLLQEVRRPVQSTQGG